MSENIKWFWEDLIVIISDFSQQKQIFHSECNECFIISDSYGCTGALGLDKYRVLTD